MGLIVHYALLLLDTCDTIDALHPDVWRICLSTLLLISALRGSIMMLQISAFVADSAMTRSFASLNRRMIFRRDYIDN